MYLGIISDVHEDIDSLRRVIDQLDRRGVDDIVCLGDMVGYSVPYYDFQESRNSNAVVALLRDRCSCLLLGNHDLYAIRQTPSHNEFFCYPANWYDLSLNERELISKGQVHLYEESECPSMLSPENISYLRSLPEFQVKNVGDHSLLLSHYAFPDCTGSSTREVQTPDDLLTQFSVMSNLGCVYGFSGHDHCDGTKAFTKSQSLGFSFEKVSLPDEPVWLHGPAVVFQRGYRSGASVYNSNDRILETLSLA